MLRDLRGLAAIKPAIYETAGRANDPVCPDDEIAKEYTKRLADGYDVELWQGDRKIETFKHTHE